MPITITKVEQPRTTNELSETLSNPTSDQLASGDACSTDNSGRPSSSASQSGSTIDESHSSNTDDETDTEDSDTTTNVVKAPCEVTPAVTNFVAVNTTVVPSETLPSMARFTDESHGPVFVLTPNDKSTHISIQGTTNAGIWNRQRSTHGDFNNELGLKLSNVKCSNSDESMLGYTNPDADSPCNKAITPKASLSPNSFSPKKDDNLCLPARSVPSASKNLPPEMAGGWGEEPEPALWKWQEMPFDYMGILEEQRRTFSYGVGERELNEAYNFAGHKG